MSEFVQLVIGGAVAGSLYAIVASSLVLSYTTSGVFNFAQGGIAFLVGLVYFELNSALGWAIVPAGVVAILVFAPLLGWGLDRAVFRGLGSASETARIVATVALGFALPAIGIFAVDRAIAAGASLLPAENVVFAPGLGPTPPEVFNLFGTVNINTNQIATLAAAAFCSVFLWYLVRFTRIGLRMRAVVDRRGLAALKGVNPDRTSSTAWMISTTLAGLAGVLAAPILTLGPGPYMLLMLVAATAAVFAGLRSIPLALLAGLLLGIVQNLVAGYIEPEVDLLGFSSAVPYVLLFIGLLILLRTRGRAGGTEAEDVPPRGLLDERPNLVKGACWAAATAGLLVYALVLANALWVGLVAAGLALGIVFMSFTVVTGVGGMVSLAQATLVMSSGLTIGFLVDRDVPYVVAALAGIAVATVLGVLVALPALRLSGLALGLATLALAFIFELVVFQIDDVRNGELGWTIPRPDLGILDLQSDTDLVIFLFIAVFAVVWLVRGLQRSASGRAAFAVRSSPLAASGSGIAPPRTKLVLFAVGGAVAGFGGALYFTFQGRVTSNDLPASIGLVWLAIVVLFGIRRPAYAVVAGVVFAMTPQFLADHITSSAVVPQIIFGLGAIGLAKSPDGWMSEVGAQIARLWRRQRGAPAGERELEPAPQGPTPVEQAAAAEPPSPAPVPAIGGTAEGALVARGLSAGYGDLQVLHDVDLVVRPSSLVAVFGANGAGKSTLAAALCGAIKPTAGTICIGERDITALPAHERARSGLVLIPEARGVFPGLTVEENLKLVLPDPSDRERAYDRLPALRQRSHAAAGVLSGGEQQMLALAALLARPPSLIVADEPSLGLAPLIVEQIVNVFVELRDRGVGLLVIEEKVHDVLPVADEIVVIDLGRVVWAGQPGDRDPDRLAETYLGLSGRSAVAKGVP